MRSTELGLRTICLFPAMHHVPVADERVARIVEIAASQPGIAVFIHCGALSVGVRTKLGLPSRFDFRLGNPLEVARLAVKYPSVPFIIPHFGAGLFREALMAADMCGNIHFDTSSSNSWIRYTPGLTLDAAFKAALSVVGPSRLLFGTDSSFFPRGWQTGIYETQKQIVEASGVSAEDDALIFGRNFDRLFPPRANSSSIAVSNTSIGWAPLIIRPLTNTVGVEVMPRRPPAPRASCTRASYFEVSRHWLNFAASSPASAAYFFRNSGCSAD